MRSEVRQLQVVGFAAEEDTPELADDEIGLQAAMYEKLFGGTFGGRDRARPWRRGIVRVESKVADKDKRTVYLLFRGHTHEGFDSQKCVLSVAARHRLGLRGGEDGFVSVCRTRRIAGRFMFLWTHPNHQVRASYKLGILATILGLVSILIALR